MPEETKAPKTLVGKLAEVMAAVGWVEKRGHNEFHNYDYAQEADLVNMLRGKLAERSIMIFPSVKEVKRSEHVTETLKWDDIAKKKLPTQRKTQLTEIAVDWTFVDGETGEERTVTIHGVGEDNMDKGFYKAFTGSDKYLLMKTFMIPTGDDPEKDSREEIEDARQAGLAAAKAKGEEKVSKYKEKSAPSASQSVPGLFYALQPSGMYAIQGDEELMRRMYKQWSKYYQKDKEGVFYMVGEEMLEQAKIQCESAGIPFSVLKAGK